MNSLALALKQHFTDAVPINQLMCQLLGSTDGLRVLEPCVGHGAFLRGLQGVPASLDVVDVDKTALDVVKERFGTSKISYHHQDFIDIFVEDLMSPHQELKTRQFDAIIANPPYGLYFDLEYRKKIKSQYPDLYARESYGLFFVFATSLLRPGGKYVFLVPDTFLTSVNHRKLRRYICNEAAPTHIIRFPSKLFETINFGYGNLCIIAGQKAPLSREGKVAWLDAFGSTELIANSPDFQSIDNKTIIGELDNGWALQSLTQPRKSLPGWKQLGEFAECRTGIYTGDNGRFIGYDARRVSKRLNGHSINWSESVCDRPLTEEEAQVGIDVDYPVYVPLARGGHRDLFDETGWAVRWDKAAIAFYKSNKKARFQNSTYYFRHGISIPMVSSGRISASILKNSVFDQGVVGVFPTASKQIPFFLIYLNSTFASKTMKRLVNGSANNSANYIKKLPVPPFSEKDITRAATLLEEIRVSGSQKLTEICDAFVTSLGAISPNQI